MRVGEPQAGLLLRRAAVAAILAASVLTAVFGRMQLLEATVQRSHLNASIRQELGKHQVLHSEILQASQPAQIDAFAQANDMVMQVNPPIYVGGDQKGR